METLNRRIITEPCTNIRARARMMLKGHWSTAVFGMLIMYVCIYFPRWILDTFLGKETSLADLLTQFGLSSSNLAGLSGQDLSTLQSTTVNISPVSNIYILLVTGTFTFGMIYIMMMLLRARAASPGDVFTGFERYGKTLGLYLYMALLVMLWTLIPFAGPVLGIVAGFRYSQSFFILFDNPDMPIPMIVSMSKYLMLGNKGKLFGLELSFIGWMLLAAVPAGIISGIASMAAVSTSVIVFATFIGCAGELWVLSYMMAAQAIFYEILLGHIQAETYIPGVY
jgi:Predicted integral membrane protein